MAEGRKPYSRSTRRLPGQLLQHHLLVILLATCLYTVRLSRAANGVLSKTAVASAACPCERSELCDFVKSEHDREFLGFFWPPSQPIDLYDWTQITDIAWVPPSRPDVICAAHAAGVRVLLNAEDVSGVLADAQARQAWAENRSLLAGSLGYDGINFDYELPAKMGSDLAFNYTDLVRVTAAAFKKINPHAKISVDVPWAAFGNDGRDYDYVGLASAADRLFVMAYDMQAQMFGRCAAAANSPLPQVLKGLQQFLDLGIPATKLILGVAWYGYDYPCEPDALGGAPDPRVDVCLLRPVEYRGTPCSDAAGTQRDFKEFMAMLRAGLNTTALTWDPLAGSPRFNYLRAEDGGRVHQVWFETPESLTLRYQLARELGLKGVGAWNLGSLEHSADGPPEARADTAAMWTAVKAFNAEDLQGLILSDHPRGQSLQDPDRGSPITAEDSLAPLL